MFAHKIADFTGPDDLQWVETEEPAADGGVLIDVAQLLARSVRTEPSDSTADRSVK